MNKREIFDVIFGAINDVDLARLEYVWPDTPADESDDVRHISAKIDGKKYSIKIIIEEV